MGLDAKGMGSGQLKIVYFDLETQLSATEVGGWTAANVRKMRMSVGVTYSNQDARYRIYAESDVQELIEELRRADLVVGYNIVGFDLHVLAGYDSLFLPEQLCCLDLMVEVQKVILRRVSLDNLSSATLGIKKTADGLQALRWFRQGQLLKIAEYCCYDVKITRLLHEFGRMHKCVYYFDRDKRKVKVPVNW